jgi:hypothetical protein
MHHMRLTSCFCRPAMVFAAPAFAFSRSVRSKVPKGSATDEGTAMSLGSLPRNLQEQ